MRLLLVEDERRLGNLLQASLHEAGFVTDRALDLADARDLARRERFDALLVDRGLPDGDGLELVRELRAAGNAVPVLVLTARDGVPDRVAGLENGADDYLVKPFAIEELIARVRAVLRRPGGALGQELRAGDIIYDAIERVVIIGARNLVLPRHELATLECLMRRLGRVVTREILIDALYGRDGEPASNAVPVHIHNLRRKLQEAGAQARIITFRGLGYMLRAEPP
uniref:Putative two component transcriptional regulator winged helix family n=1 Tax=uncultured bacterium CBNPD1 BAC clone 67 TaxID=417306 RepID=B1N6D8_9BACT|nr:putative two component transcriptional regulator winged helix family [uncultured bacterium CBNPD1 BAC clone 67]